MCTACVRVGLLTLVLLVLSVSQSYLFIYSTMVWHRVGVVLKCSLLFPCGLYFYVNVVVISLTFEGR